MVKLRPCFPLGLKLLLGICHCLPTSQIQKTNLLARILLLFGFFCVTAFPLGAAHIIGGEITYECLGYTNDDPATQSRRYRFTMKIYRDCQGGGADFDSAPQGAFITSVSIYLDGETVPFNTLYLGAPAEVSIDPDPGNPCVEVPPGICVEVGTYVFPVIDLPIEEESYYIVYQRCCRNNTISNVTNPGGSGATYFIELTAAAQATCNNSPVFNDFPPVVLCAGEPFTFDHSATDPEGHLLVYELCAPFLGGGLNFDFPFASNGIAPDPDQPPPYDPVNFIAPAFSPSNPLGNQAITLNSSLGILTGTPGLLGQFVVGICVSEYSNSGELLSTVRRDFQFNVTNCEVQVSAAIQGANVQDNGVFLFEICGDTEVDFINQSGQISNIEAYRWTFDLPGNPLLFDTRNVSVTFPGAGEYSGLLTLNPGTTCSDSAQLLIRIFPEVSADFTYDYDSCVAGPVAFTDQSLSGAGTIESWQWSFGDGEQGMGRNPSHRYLQPGVKTVQLTVTDPNGCQATSGQEVTYFPVPGLIIIAPSAYEGCAPAGLFFDNLSTPIDASYQVNWDFGDGNTAEGIDAWHEFGEVGQYDISLEIISPIGCRTDTVFPGLIEIFPRPTAGFAYNPARLDNFNATAAFQNLSFDADFWSWDFNGQFNTSVREPTYTFPDTGRQVVQLIASTRLGCRDTALQVIDVAPLVTFHLPNAFSPNGDSVNDLFYGKGFLRGLRQFDLQIWNRWGELLFRTSNPATGWDGRAGSSGREAPPGVYVCLLRYTGPRGEKVEQKSMVTLIR